MTTSINEVSLMTETEKRYRIYERMLEMYEGNYDWKNVMSCKWSMLVNQGGSL